MITFRGGKGNQLENNWEFLRVVPSLSRKMGELGYIFFNQLSRTNMDHDGRLDLRRRKLVAFSSSRHNEKGGREKKMMTGIYVSLSFTVQQQTSGNDRWS